jgi:hypothetical protein
MVQDFNNNGVPDYLEPREKPSFSSRVPPIKLPGIPGGVQASEAYNWFKFVGAKAAKGTPARKAYDAFTARLAAMGIPKSKWDSVWKDAVDWTQTVGTTSTGDPSGYLAILDPSDYADTSGSTKKYGTTKSKTSTTTQYSPSDAGGYINRTIESEIGRTATKEEVDAYIAGVNAEAAKSPAIYEATTTTAPGTGGMLGTSETKATSTTGFDPAMYALNFARSRPDFAESFATKSVLGLIQRILRDPNAIGNVVQ